MPTIKELKELISSLQISEQPIHCTLSSPLHKSSPNKMVFRSITKKEAFFYQCEEQVGEQVFHRNLTKEESSDYLYNAIISYKQTYLSSPHSDYQILVNKRGRVTIIKRPSTKTVTSSEHNRQKNYFLKEGVEIPFLIHLGVMTPQGRVISSKMSKFRQINRFLEMVDDTLTHLPIEKVIHIVDFGCGKAYLTFALYHFLHIIKGLQVKLTGIDLKKQAIAECQKLSASLGYDRDLTFIHGDIDHYTPQQEIDLMIALHACDTATDAALEKAIRWQAKVILAVPCCQHELYSQIDNNALKPLLKHGILKERFASLATDAARAQLLEMMGYEVQVLEFIDIEHTPKNLLIRAYKQTKTSSSSLVEQDYKTFKDSLRVTPSLEVRLTKTRVN